VPIDFRHGIGPEALRPVERMSHRGHPSRRDGLELVHHGNDARKLGRDVCDLGGGDFEASEPTQSVDVFGAKHRFLDAATNDEIWSREWTQKSELRNEVIDFSLDNTRRLWIGLPVVKVAPRFP
jgi:hypothetical protein